MLEIHCITKAAVVRNSASSHLRQCLLFVRVQKEEEKYIKRMYGQRWQK